jgi:hypothetical protein
MPSAWALMMTRAEATAAQLHEVITRLIETGQPAVSVKLVCARGVGS